MLIVPGVSLMLAGATGSRPRKLWAKGGPKSRATGEF
jgi:hypothetical protein